MSEQSKPPNGAEASEAAPGRRAPKRRRRFLKIFVAATVAYHLVHFTFASEIDLLTPPLWQSGRLRDHAALMMRWPALWPLVPLWMVSAACLVRIVFQKSASSIHRADRFGVFLGAFIQLHYAAIFGARAFGWGELPANSGGWRLAWAIAALCGRALAAAAVASGIALLVVGVTLLVVWGAARLAGRAARMGRAGRFAALGAVALAVVAAAVGLALSAEAREGVVSYLVLAYWLFPLLGAPYVLLGLYLATLLAVVTRAAERLRFGFAELMGAVGWLSLYFAYLGHAIRVAWQEYEKLPTTQPSRCYVATAALQGHPWLVRSRTFRRDDGSIGRVNQQLLRLKLAELALAAVAPRLHRRLRAAYDAFAPALASRLTSPWAADAVYLLLKPAEWMAHGALFPWRRKYGSQTPPRGLE